VLPISSPLSTQGALREAKEEGGVEALTDITIDEISSFYILFSSHCVYVEGLGVVPEVASKRLK
jgi:8-oxo-dGTP pyrophosphatase MutT (NUDIX family)